MDKILDADTSALDHMMQEIYTNGIKVSDADKIWQIKINTPIKSNTLPYIDNLEVLKRVNAVSNKSTLMKLYKSLIKCH